MRQFSHRGFRIGSHLELNRSHLDEMVDLFEAQPEKQDRPLGGRLSITRAHLEGIGPVVVKHYRRGGLLANLITQYYVTAARARSRIEFEQMQLVRMMGVQAPEPVACAYRGLFVYKAWLVTREVPQVRTMVEFSQKSPDRIAAVMTKLEQQLDILVDNRIVHADFHPGNILIDDREQVYIIDFDKSAAWRGSKAKLALQYRARWCRAVKKHGLSMALCTQLGIGAPRHGTN